MSKILLREINRDDLATINSWRSDKDIVGLLGGAFRHVGREVDEKWFDAYLAARANNVRLAICLAHNSDLIGVVYLLQIDWITRSGEFSIQIADNRVQGLGYGEEATRQMLRHAFFDLNLRRIHLTVLATNQRAIALYQKVGFTKEGCFRQAAYKNGSYVDVISMALLKNEFAECDESAEKQHEFFDQINGDKNVGKRGSE